jgi:drug/metabolite transporter (DMT)-like permease
LVAGILMVALAAASWGTWTLFLHPTGLPGLVTTPIVFATMAIVGLPIALVEKPAPNWDRTTVRLLLANAAFDALNVVCFFSALDYTTVQIAVLSHYATPILIALAAPRIDKVATPGAKLAALVAAGGLVVILEPWNAPAAGAVAGAALGLASAVCYAGNVFCVRRLVGRIGAARAMSYHSAIAAVVLLPFAWSRLHQVDGDSLARIVLGGIGPGTIAGIVFARGLARIGSARSAILTFAEPLVAVGCGAIAWGEPLEPLAAVGGAMILGAGIYVARRSS